MELQTSLENNICGIQMDIRLIRTIKVEMCDTINLFWCDYPFKELKDFLALI